MSRRTASYLDSRGEREEEEEEEVEVEVEEGEANGQAQDHQMSAQKMNKYKQ